MRCWRHRSAAWDWYSPYQSIRRKYPSCSMGRISPIHLNQTAVVIVAGRSAAMNQQKRRYNLTPDTSASPVMIAWYFDCSGPTHRSHYVMFAIAQQMNRNERCVGGLVLGTTSWPEPPDTNCLSGLGCLFEFPGYVYGVLDRHTCLFSPDFSRDMCNEHVSFRFSACQALNPCSKFACTSGARDN